MYVSVFLGPFARFAGDDKPLIDYCLQQAEDAAAAGFAMVTFGEQHLNNYEPYCNPFLMAARLSPVLGECWFGTTIVPMVFHHPLRLVEDSNIIDVLTGGRFIMGMSAGRAGFSSDFEIFAVDAARREEIFDSRLEIMNAARTRDYTSEPFVYDTPFDKGVLTGRMMPVAYRDPGPLLAVGTSTDATIDKTARRGMPVFLGPCLPTDAAAKFALYRSAAAAAGHDEATVELALTRSLVTRHVIVDRTVELAWERVERMAGRNPMLRREGDPRSLRELSEIDLSTPEAKADPANRNAVWVQSWIIAGPPDSVAEQILHYGEIGVPQLNTRFTVGPFNPTEMTDSFELFVNEVLPNVEPQLLAGPRDTEIRSEHRGGGAPPPGFRPPHALGPPPGFGPPPAANAGTVGTAAEAAR